MQTVEQVVDYLREAIASFDDDPADTDHQEGYLEALQETLRVIGGQQPPRPRPRAQLRLVKGAPSPDSERTR